MSARPRAMAPREGGRVGAGGRGYSPPTGERPLWSTAVWRRAELEALLEMRVLGRFRRTVVVMLVPLVMLGVFALGVQAYSLVRYDPRLFAGAYLERYDQPPRVAAALEAALRAGDGALLAELQGLRSPVRFEPSPEIALVMLLDSDDRYTTYLYIDRGSYERMEHHVERVGGRWVVAPVDLYYHIHSGRWHSVFLRLALVWWTMCVLVPGALWSARRSWRLRQWLYRDGS